MKNRTNSQSFNSFLSIAGILFASIHALYCEESPEPSRQSTPLRFTGSEQKYEEALAKADIVFEGQVNRVGQWAFGPSGETAYNGVRITVSQIFKGSIESPADVFLYVRHDNVIEAPPETGKAYIFFVRQLNQKKVLKLVPATDENVAKTKQLIAQSPK